MPRMRSIDWKSPDELNLDMPLPQLQSLKTCAACPLDRFISGVTNKLHSLDEGDDLVQRAMAWDAPHIDAVELNIRASSILDESTSLHVRPFFARAVALSIGDWNTAQATVRLAATDATGRTRALAFNRGGWRYDRDAPRILARAIWLSIAHSAVCAILGSIALPPEELNHLLDFAGAGVASLRSVASLVLHVRQVYVHRSESDEIDSDDERTMYKYRWPALGAFVGRVRAHFPALASFIVQVYQHAELRPDSAQDARGLLRQLAMHGVAGLPVLHVNGFGRDIVLAIDPQDVEQLPMRVVFSLPND